MFEKIINFLQGLGIVQDIAENARTTDTDIKDNKPQKRQYHFDDGMEKIPTSRAEYKNKTAKRKQKTPNREER